MKINPLGSSGVNPYTRQSNQAESVKAASIQKKDKLEISTAAKELQQSLQIPAERQAKVDELKNQVENGTYKLNAQDTAKSILNYFKQ